MERNVEVCGGISYNPDEIIYIINLCDYNYTECYRKADQFRGWGKSKPIIPELFSYCYKLGRFPRIEELYNHTMGLCDPEYKNEEEIKFRGKKLSLDFAREMHTFGLLQISRMFGVVKYGKSYDLNYNVDFLGRLVSWFNIKDEVGIQSMMRANFNNDVWSNIKSQRRMRRGTKEFDGTIYELSNRKIKDIKNIKGLWLFTDKHIKELKDQIIDEGCEEIGIQTEFILN